MNQAGISQRYFHSWVWKMWTYCAGILIPLLLAVGVCQAQEEIQPQTIHAIGLAPPSSPQLTQQPLAPNGISWDSPQSLQLPDGTSGYIFDFGTPVMFEGFLVQADHNDSYFVEYSNDQETWTILGVAAPVFEASGMQTRGGRVSLPAPIRYIKIRPGPGDGHYSISRVLFLKGLPNQWSGDPQTHRSILSRFVNHQVIDAIKRILPLVACCIFIGLVLVRRHPKLTQARRLLSVLFASCALFGFMSWFELFRFHQGAFVHQWDFMHYYLGGKFFPEVGYQNLYKCIGVADQQDGLSLALAASPIRDLKTNIVRPANEILENPQECTDAFSAARWHEFQDDVRWFRSTMAQDRWASLKRDHGFNAPPAWLIIGNSIASFTHASARTSTLLALIDPVLIVLMAGCLGWAFGWQVAALCIIFFGTNFPARFFWTGGSFLRQDWLFFSVLSVCLLRRGYALGSGLALSIAFQLRVFPGLMALPPLFQILFRNSHPATFGPPIDYRRWLLGGLIGLSVLVPLSLVVSSHRSVYQEFMQNSKKHLETPLTNNMGLLTAIAYTPSHRGEYVRDALSSDAYGIWKDLRHQDVRETRPYYLIFLALYLILLVIAVRNIPPWAALALGAGAVAICVDLTCYYYSIFLLLGVLTARWPATGILLLLTSWLSWELELALGWYDSLFAWESRIFVALVFLVTAIVAFRKPSEMTPSPCVEDDAADLFPSDETTPMRGLR